MEPTCELRDQDICCKIQDNFVFGEFHYLFFAVSAKFCLLRILAQPLQGFRLPRLSTKAKAPGCCQQ